MQSSFKYFLLFVCFCFTATACTKKTNERITDTSQLMKIIEIYKSPCFGKCPVYTLSIYDNGLATYEGKINTDLKGMNQRFLSDTEFSSIKAAFKKSNWMSLKDNYPSGVSDLPKKVITYHTKEQSKKVVGDMKLPEVVNAIVLQLDAIAKNGNWIHVETTTEEKMGDNNNPIIENEILVDFKDGISAEEFIKEFATYDLKIKKQVVPNSSIYLLEFNPEKIKPAYMLNTLKNNKQIKVAEFNKRVSERGIEN